MLEETKKVRKKKKINYDNNLNIRIETEALNGLKRIAQEDNINNYGDIIRQFIYELIAERENRK